MANSFNRRDGNYWTDLYEIHMNFMHNSLLVYVVIIKGHDQTKMGQTYKKMYIQSSSRIYNIPFKNSQFVYI